MNKDRCTLLCTRYKRSLKEKFARAVGGLAMIARINIKVIPRIFFGRDGDKAGEVYGAAFA